MTDVIHKESIPWEMAVFKGALEPVLIAGSVYGWNPLVLAI
jgi:hypothetical protein